MTRDDAQSLYDSNADLRKSIDRQVDVEFEGYHPGHEFPQDRQIQDNLNQIEAAGYLVNSMTREVLDRDQFTAIREAWNANVREWIASHPGPVPSTQVNEWVKQFGVRLATLKAGVKFFDLA